MSREQRFEFRFRSLTGFAPLSWQTRLYSGHFENGELPAAVEVPTGLGKTAVMALWLIARANGVRLPRRLMYVVDRRAVVDQATEFAEGLRKNLDEPHSSELKTALGLSGASLRISTLRGQHVDNREWLEDPSATAIIVGTVDMVGSRLLFEGYGVSRKMRPYHAGLIGADTLVVLDEAHLVPPFERLLDTIENGAEEFGPGDLADRKRVPAFRLLSLSATGRYRPGSVFRLVDSDIEHDDIAAKRLRAKKEATLVKANGADLDAVLAEHAWRLKEQSTTPVRCLVYCDRRDTAERTIDSLRSKARGTGVETELFVGARRVFERTWAAKRLKELGFMADDEASSDKAVFLVATSAGEVGVDLDADHMVCDLVAWERMVQRLGRVNRRGNGDATVIVVDPGEPQPKKNDNPTREENEAIERHRAVLELLQAMPNKPGDAVDVSPAALWTLRIRAEKKEPLRRLMEAATTRPPLRPELTRALADAWSMTALKTHTGRPEVAPWLRGWVEERPRTAVVWRMHLPTLDDNRAMSDRDVESFFEAAPPHASESLDAESWRVADWMIAQVDRLCSAEAKAENEVNEIADEGSTLANQSNAGRQNLGSSDVLAFVVSAAGDLLTTLSANGIERLEKQALERLLQNKTLVVDARIAGLSSDGLLDRQSNAVPRTADDGAEWIEDAGVPVTRFRVRVRTHVPGAGMEQDRNWRERLRLAKKRNQDEETVRWLVVDKWRHDGSTEDDRSAGRAQSLQEHQSWTERAALGLGSRLGLDKDYVDILACAARLHDEGKRAERWQRAFNAPRGQTYAKTRGPLNRALLAGYRHEFGSLRYAEVDEGFRKLKPEAQELVLHLIAAHHGRARPVISTRSCEDAPPSVLEERARNIALRFAAMQKRWGPWGLAWWEALLRAADQQASRKNDERENATDGEAA